MMVLGFSSSCERGTDAAYSRATEESLGLVDQPGKYLFSVRESGREKVDERWRGPLGPLGSSSSQRRRTPEIVL